VILYLDASALVKRYIEEPGSDAVEAAIAQADIVGTSLISRAEVSATLSKAVRVNVLTPEVALRAAETFRGQWLDLVRVQITELVIARADVFAWEYGLRGYDAVHLAAASTWAEAMNEKSVLATFDRSLWLSSRKAGLIPYPADLPAMLEEWKRAPGDL
jgi:predicted nucleic acid-binding protein